MRKLFALAAVLCLALVAGSVTSGGDAKDHAADEKALKTRADEFIAAFNNGDGKALAGFWTADGDYMEQGGQIFSGRQAIQEAFEKQFAAIKGAKLRINPTAPRFATPDMAIEDGTTEVVYANGGPPTGARYTAIHVKQDGQWYLASVRDAVLVPPANNAQLRDLAWLEGDWVDEAEAGEVVRASYSWAENENFLVSTFETTLKDVPVSGGTQWIGWDGAAKQIHSWSFNSNGSISEGAWANEGDKWVSKVTVSLPDGKKALATVTITRVDADHLSWQSTNRSVDGKALPNTELVKMKRAK
jgi:uncharacterized protein (TIGR02246 family)